MLKEVKWNDRFNLGVEVIDRAHQRLFSIVGRMLALNEDSAKQRHACREGIKYFKSYTLKHFAEEEAYMQSINYPGYAVHKSLHENLRTQTLPALEAELEDRDYCIESVQHFLGICVGWLNGHIMIEDRAIAGKNPTKWVHRPEEDELADLAKAVTQGLHAMCQVEAQLISKHYSGEDFASDKTLCYRLSYRSKDKRQMQVFLVFEESLILHTLNNILGEEFKKVDKTVVSAMKILSEQFVDFLAGHFVLGAKYMLEKNDLQTYEQFVRTFDKQYPPYSLLFNTGGKGYFAIVIKQIGII